MGKMYILTTGANPLQEMKNTYITKLKCIIQIGYGFKHDKPTSSAYDSSISHYSITNGESKSKTYPENFKKKKKYQKYNCRL